MVEIIVYVVESELSIETPPRNMRQKPNLTICTYATKLLKCHCYFRQELLVLLLWISRCALTRFAAAIVMWKLNATQKHKA